jgi:hypothetical protein
MGSGLIQGFQGMAERGAEAAVEKIHPEDNRLGTPIEEEQTIQ